MACCIGHDDNGTNLLFDAGEAARAPLLYKADNAVSYHGTCNLYDGAANEPKISAEYHGRY